MAMIQDNRSIKDAPEKILQRCPRLVAHLIAESLGYATPMTAAHIIADAHAHRENFCEWIYSCFSRDPRPAVERAVRYRKHHHGYMADYGMARAIVARAQQGDHPMFASWF